MSVHQTSNGRWFVRYPKGKIPEHPNRTREYFGRGVEAELAARERNRELGLGLEKAERETSPTFTELCQAYLNAKAPAMAEASYTALKSKLEGVVLPRLGDFRATQLTPENLDRYVSDRLKPYVRKYGERAQIITPKLTTVHRDLSDIRAILRWSVKRKYILYNPMEGFEFPRRDDEVIRPPTVEEVKAILQCAAPHLFRAIILSYYTGVRAGAVELLGMTWHDVDLINGNIVIRSADKGGLRSRIVPIMDQDLSDLLGQWLNDDLAAKKRLDEPIITFKGKPVGSLKSAWNAAKMRAGITRRLRMYDFRHSFATKLLDNGADLKHVSSLLGHRSIQQTVDTYQHLSKKLSEDAVKRLPSVLIRKQSKL